MSTPIIKARHLVVDQGSAAGVFAMLLSSPSFNALSIDGIDSDTSPVGGNTRAYTPSSGTPPRLPGLTTFDSRAIPCR